MTDTPEMQPFTPSAFDEMLGTPVLVNEEVVQQAITDGRCSALVFELYKEAASVVVVTGHLSSSAAHTLKRNQAICMGLLVRVAKFMTVVMQLTSESDRREVVLALNRSIIESTVNLRFLLKKNNDALFESFVRASLGPERELYNVIQKNVSARGQTLPIEERMLASIERVVNLSGLTIDQVSTKRQDWGGTLRDRMKAIDEEYMYLFAQRIPSHAVHGSWVDLLLHHIDERGDGFVPDSDWKSVDARALGPISQLVLEAIPEYLDRYFGSIPDTQTIRDRVRDLTDRTAMADAAHERWMQLQHGSTSES